MPRVSVIVPTRNRRAALARALASVDAQSVRDLEIVVIDDGSTDGTAAWLRAERPAVRLLELESPIGAGAARNRGWALARGNWLAFLDDDDRWRPNFLEAQLSRLAANVACDLAHADHVEIDAAGRISIPDLRAQRPEAPPLVRMLADCFVHTLSAVVCRRSLFDRFGGFDEALDIVHDFEWFLRLLADGVGFVRTPLPLVERAVPGGLVTGHRAWFEEERRVIDARLAATPIAHRDERFVRASRALLFARIGLAKRDLGFGCARAAEALRAAPVAAVGIAARRLLRLASAGPRRAPAAWDDTALGVP